MNQLTCAVNETALQDGNAAQVNPTTDVFQNGSSAMEKMIVEIIATNCQKTAQFVIPTQTSNVITTDAFQDNGPVILLTIAEMEVMSKKAFVKENIASVQSQNSVAKMENVFQADGVAITRTIVETLAMSFIAKDSNAKTELSNVLLATVSLLTSAVMAIGIVETCLTNWTVPQDSQVADIVQNLDSNVPTTCVSLHLTCVMEQTIAATILTSLQRFVQTSTVTL